MHRLPFVGDEDIMTSLDLHELRQRIGGRVYGRDRWSGPGPGHSKQDASLSVVITADGRPLVHSFAGDSFKACTAYLGLQDAKPASAADLARERAARKAEAEKAEAEARAFCSGIWDSATPFPGSPAELYLFNRGLEYEGNALRFHGAAPRSRRPRGATHQAMVAIVRAPDGRASGLHLTYITANGRKAFGDRSRLMFGKTREGALRLMPLGVQGRDLAVAEGIETALAFAALKGVPTWAALSSSGLCAFVPPPSIRRLLIAADSDDSGAGMGAAKALAESASRTCDVTICAAPAGKDWADVLMERGHV
jgi:phage/plasmid primase-like uncharacterized protein